MGGSSWFSAGSSIRFYLLADLVAVQPGVFFDAFLELVAGTEGHDAARRDGNLFAGLGVASRARVLVAQGKVAEAGELYVVAFRERGPDLVEEQLDKLFGFPLVQAQFVKQGFRQICL